MRGGLDTLKIGGDLDFCLGGISPQKLPRGDRTEAEPDK